MRWNVIIVTTVLTVTTSTLLAATKEDQATDAGQAKQTEHGAYLAHSVAMCVVCHTPKGEDGLPIEGKEFEGGVIPVKPTYPGMEPWASSAPALGPLVRGAPEDVIELLQTGIWPHTQKAPRRPMPPFQLTEQDAHAVVAYLRSPKDEA